MLDLFIFAYYSYSWFISLIIEKWLFSYGSWAHVGFQILRLISNYRLPHNAYRIVFMQHLHNLWLWIGLWFLQSSWILELSILSCFKKRKKPLVRRTSKFCHSHSLYGIKWVFELNCWAIIWNYSFFWFDLLISELRNFSTWPENLELSHKTCNLYFKYFREMYKCTVLEYA